MLKSRTNRRAQQACANSACTAVYDRLGALELANALLIKAARGLEPLTSDERTSLSNLLAAAAVRDRDSPSAPPPSFAPAEAMESPPTDSATQPPTTLSPATPTSWACLA